MLVPPPIPGFGFFQGPSVKIGQFHLSKCVVSNWQCGPKKNQGIGYTVHELAAQRTHTQLGGGLEYVLFSSPKYGTMTPDWKGKIPCGCNNKASAEGSEALRHARWKQTSCDLKLCVYLSSSFGLLIFFEPLKFLGYLMLSWCFSKKHLPFTSTDIRSIPYSPSIFLHFAWQSRRFSDAGGSPGAQRKAGGNWHRTGHPHASLTSLCGYDGICRGSPKHRKFVQGYYIDIHRLYLRISI